MKIIRVNKCNGCMYRVWEQNEDENETREICGKIIPHKLLDRSGEIPSWCPLEDAKNLGGGE